MTFEIEKKITVELNIKLTEDGLKELIIDGIKRKDPTIRVRDIRFIQRKNPKALDVEIDADAPSIEHQIEQPKQAEPQAEIVEEEPKQEVIQDEPKTEKKFSKKEKPFMKMKAKQEEAPESEEESTEAEPEAEEVKTEEKPKPKKFGSIFNT